MLLERICKPELVVNHPNFAHGSLAVFATLVTAGALFCPWSPYVAWILRPLMVMLDLYLVAILLEAAARAQKQDKPQPDIIAPTPEPAETIRQADEAKVAAGGAAASTPATAATNAAKPPDPRTVCLPFPDRTWSVPLVFLWVASAVLGFASLYLHSHTVCGPGLPLATEAHAMDPGSHAVCAHGVPLANTGDAIYFSVVTITTSAYGEFVPVHLARWLVVWQLGTGLLLFAGVFTLLIARISNF